MGEHARPHAQEADRPRLGLGTAAEAFILALAVALVLFARRAPAVSGLAIVFVSIVLEALPFMLIGAVLGGAVEVFVSRERMEALLPRNRWGAIAAAAAMGLLFPICECAIVPVVRRLLRKGFPASAAMAYLLGGPVFNPVVAASTAVAYRPLYGVAVLRMAAGYVIAVAVAVLMERFFPGNAAIRPDAGPGEGCACGACHGHEPERGGVAVKFAGVLRAAAHDFIGVGHYLVIGAFVAALAQTFISRAAFLRLADTPLAAVVLMMALAIALNLCSEADAFVAASFRGLAPLPAQMAFMLVGPMFDLKLLLMYQTIFRRRAILALAVLIVGSCFLVSLAMTLGGAGR